VPETELFCVACWVKIEKNKELDIVYMPTDNTVDFIFYISSECPHRHGSIGKSCNCIFVAHGRVVEMPSQYIVQAATR